MYCPIYDQSTSLVTAKDTRGVLFNDKWSRTGNRIMRVSTLRGMTHKDLGIALGFPARSADVRVAQYESGSMTPKEDMIQEMAKVLKVKPGAIADPSAPYEEWKLHYPPSIR